MVDKKSRKYDCWFILTRLYAIHSHLSTMATLKTEESTRFNFGPKPWTTTPCEKI